MNTQEIADELVSLLKYGKFEQAQKELFAQEIVSIEPEKANIPDMKGLDAILQKGEQFRNSVEAWHGITISEPLISGNVIALSLRVDLTFKGQEKSSMDEIVVYQVEAGKIIHEQFFY